LFRARATSSYIPANVPHLPYNASQTEPCVAVIHAPIPNEQESVVLLPELERYSFDERGFARASSADRAESGMR